MYILCSEKKIRSKNEDSMLLRYLKIPLLYCWVHALWSVEDKGFHTSESTRKIHCVSGLPCMCLLSFDHTNRDSNKADLLLRLHSLVILWQHASLTRPAAEQLKESGWLTCWLITLLFQKVEENKRNLVIGGVINSDQHTSRDSSVKEKVRASWKEVGVTSLCPPSFLDSCPLRCLYNCFSSS